MVHKLAGRYFCWYPYIIPFLSYISLFAIVYGENILNKNVINVLVVQRKLIRTVTSPCRAHAKPLMMVNRLMFLFDINVYVTWIFVHTCLHGCAPNIFNEMYTGNRNARGRKTSQACDRHVPHGGLGIPDSKVHGAHIEPTWGRQDLCGPHVGHTKIAIWH